jgi:tetratricopeptide (TPR) repeat protein
VWYALAHGVSNQLGHFEEMAQAAEESIRNARLAGQHSFRLAGLPVALLQGPRPADEALETLDSVLPPNPDSEAALSRSVLLAMLGRFSEAWSLALPVAERWRELGGEAELDYQLAAIAVLAGDEAKAAAYLRGMCEMLERRGSRGYLSTYAPMYGRSLCALGRYQDAEPLAALGRELGGADDFFTQILWRQVQARVCAHRGDHARAEVLAREAIVISERTDALNAQGDALCDLAEVLAADGRTDEAAAALEQALERYERKKNLAMVAQTQPKLEELRAHVS